MKKIKILSIAAILLLTVFTAFKPAPGYKVGDNVKDFKLKNVDGKMVSLADFKGARGYIVVFTCNHCPFSKAYESRIIELNKMYASKGFPVIAINPNDVKIVPEDSYENMQALAKEKEYKFPYLLDETQQVAKDFGATRTPHVFIITRVQNDNIVSYIGAIDDNSDDPAAVKVKYVQNAMEDIIARNPVKENFTKAVGCSIKWKVN